MARQLFSKADVANKTVVARVPRPEDRPYFAQLFGEKKTNRRKRRGSVTPLRYLPPGAIIIAEPQDRTSVGESGRSTYQQPRSFKLSPEQVGVIQRTHGRTLRDLATDYGVSHETIRAARLSATPDNQRENVQRRVSQTSITPNPKR